MTPLLSLPLDIEGVTAPWLSAALSASFPHLKITRLRRAAVMQGTATKVRVHIEQGHGGSQGELPASLIVKGGFSAHRELMSYIYRLEARFYTEIAPLLPLRVPRCFFAGIDPGSGQGVVVLEDLDESGVHFCRVETPLSFAQAALHLDAFAQMHACWWNSAEFRPGGRFDWVEALDPLPQGSAGAYQRGQLRPEVFKQYTALPRGVAIAREFHDRDRMERALERLRQIDAGGSRCFLHGDYHLGNLFFDRDRTAGVLDWQSFRQGPWAHDVTYFMLSALDMGERREWEAPLLRHYLKALADAGACAPAFADAWEAYLGQIVYGLYYWLVNPPEFQAELNNCAVAPRFALAALDHRMFERLGV